MRCRSHSGYAGSSLMSVVMVHQHRAACGLSRSSGSVAAAVASGLNCAMSFRHYLRILCLTRKRS